MRVPEAIYLYHENHEIIVRQILFLRKETFKTQKK